MKKTTLSAAAPSTPVSGYPPPPSNATLAQQREYERNRWNYSLLDATWRQTRFNPEPNTLLVETVRNYLPGAALDINMGEGRNALFLARQGWQVTGVDYADKALDYAQRQAHELGLRLTTVVSDLTAYDWGIDQWDLIVLCYADEDAHVEQVREALRPGGLLVFENFHTDINQARKLPVGQEIGFPTDELKKLYTAAGFQILRYEEPIDVADFSLETQRLVRLVVRKG